MCRVLSLSTWNGASAAMADYGTWPATVSHPVGGPCPVLCRVWKSAEVNASRALLAKPRRYPAEINSYPIAAKSLTSVAQG